jgi:hypothetical protein
MREQSEGILWHERRERYRPIGLIACDHVGRHAAGVARHGGDESVRTPRSPNPQTRIPDREWVDIVNPRGDSGDGGGIPDRAMDTTTD